MLADQVCMVANRLWPNVTSLTFNLLIIYGQDRRKTSNIAEYWLILPDLTKGKYFTFHQTLASFTCLSINGNKQTIWFFGIDYRVHYIHVVNDNFSCFLHMLKGVNKILTFKVILP